MHFYPLGQTDHLVGQYTTIWTSEFSSIIVFTLILIVNETTFGILEESSNGSSYEMPALPFIT